MACGPSQGAARGFAAGPVLYPRYRSPSGFHARIVRARPSRALEFLPEDVSGLQGLMPQLLSAPGSMPWAVVPVAVRGSAGFVGGGVGRRIFVPCASLSGRIAGKGGWSREAR